ncbi:DUF1330 domain-containing protein [Streptomyces sp. NPDC001903]|uniref:DUF1330 domain-containing protein n=1 Tax=Streptomyces sp. NPDC001903 TaxID=3364622 RepID=UPI0036968390
MMRASGLVPTAEQAAGLLGGEGSGEIVMLNLLKFSDRPEEYGRYEELVRERLADVGAELRWVGLVEHLVVGDPALDGWDAVALVAYPSKEAFTRMVTSSQYQEAAGYRDRGLAATVLLCCTGREGAE